MAEYSLDITAHTCPMTFVKTKLRLEEMALGDVLIIRLRDGEARHNVPRSLKEHGQEVLAERALGGGVHELRVKKRCA